MVSQSNLNFLAIATYVSVIAAVFLFVFYALPKISGGIFTEGLVIQHDKRRNSGAIHRISEYAKLRDQQEDASRARLYSNNMKKLVEKEARARTQEL